MQRLSRFVGVALPGFGLQLLVVSLLLGAGVHYLVATLAGVEAAILHNFLWHRSWTWKDRPAGMLQEEGTRLLRFHLSNGVVSLAGHTLLVPLSVQFLHTAPILANGIAVCCCGLGNFLVADRYVFQACSRTGCK